MMKKVFKFGLMMSLMLASVSAFAQSSSKVEYPHYSFFSNWSVGASLDLNWEIQQGPMGFNDARWRVSTNIGNDLVFQKELDYILDLRLRLGAPSWGDPRTDLTGDGDFCDLDRHWTATIDALISINDAILGYDPDRRFSIYQFVGAGAKFSGNFFDLSDPERDNIHPSMAKDGRATVVVDAGLGMSYRVCENSTLFCEYGMDMTELPDIFAHGINTFDRWHNTNAILRVGYMYNFGLTAADKAIAAQKSMLTEENFGALNSQIDNLQNQVNNSRNNEKKLENRIAQLEDQLAKARADQAKVNNSAAADSLQAVIDQIKADQLNFYAMPFSVLYGVDQWQVPASESDKVKAVARVLKDNPGVKIMVVGFADYTGSDQYNMKLSEKRANEVKRLLVNKYGIAEDRIQTDYKGKSVAFGDIQYALNRRVSFYRVIE